MCIVHTQACEGRQGAGQLLGINMFELPPFPPPLQWGMNCKTEGDSEGLGVVSCRWYFTGTSPVPHNSPGNEVEGGGGISDGHIFKKNFYFLDFVV